MWLIRGLVSLANVFFKGVVFGEAREDPSV